MAKNDNNMMSSSKEVSSRGEESESEWEDVVTMMELPNGANLNISKKDLYLQVAGMWTDKPVVKLDNMLYVGNVSDTIGTHLFVECKEGDEAEKTHKKKNDGREIWTAQTTMTLEPVYLEKKSGESNSQTQPACSNSNKEEKEKT